MKDKLHQALTALLIMVPGTISLSMGNTSIMPYKGCAACPPGEIACLPTQKVLILHAVRVFKYICSCKGMPTCDAPCCNDPGGSCTHEYSDSEVRDLQESCQDTHTCLVRALQGTTHCGEKEFYVFSLLDYMCVDRPAAQVSNETSVQGKIVYVELANRNGGYEKTTCVAESQSKENLQISFVIVNWRPGTQVAVNLGEVTHELSQRKTKYSVTSPETLSFAQLPGNAEVTLWAIIEGEDSEVSVNCTREVIPVPKGEGDLRGAVMVGVIAAVVGLFIIVPLAVCIIRRWRSPPEEGNRLRNMGLANPLVLVTKLKDKNFGHPGTA